MNIKLSMSQQIFILLFLSLGLSQIQGIRTHKPALRVYVIQDLLISLKSGTS